MQTFAKRFRCVPSVWLACGVLVATVVRGETWYVSKSGHDTNAGNVVAAPLASVTNALAKASPNDLIAVAGGTYTQSVRFAVGQSNIVIRGGYEPGTWNWAPSNNVSVIRATNGACISVTNDAGYNILANLTVTTGGGIYDGIVVNGTNGGLTVDGVVMISNRYGLTSSSSTLTNLVMKNCVVTRNGNNGVNIGSVRGACWFLNCTISSNGSRGVYIAAANMDDGVIVPVFKNCIVADNVGLGVYRIGVTAGGSLQNCLFYGNRDGAVVGRNIEDLGGNKCGRSPRYVNAGGLDFRLTSNSPAAGAGTDVSALGVTTDILGASRPQGGWDIGAYEADLAGESSLPGVVYVSTNGSNATGDGSTNNPWATIGYALGNVATAGTVRVAAGSYAENVFFGPGHRYVTVKGGYNPTTWVWEPATNRTLVDGATKAPVEIGLCSDTATVSCLTLTGGTTANNAGVLFRSQVYGVTVDGCTIYSNYYGIAGVLVRMLTVRNCVVAANQLHGLSFSAGRNYGGSTCYLYNSTVAGNGLAGYYANSGDAAWTPISPVVVNTLFTDNGSYGIYRYGHSAGSIANCLFFNNTTGTTFGTITDLGGNKSGRDPLYVDAAAFDFRVAANSPAAAAGSNLTAQGISVDIVGTTRPGPNGWDMGAYQGDGAGESSLLSVAYVRTNGSNSTGNGSTNNPWATVSYAVANVTETGIVRVAAGTYVDSVQFAADRKGILVQGGYDPDTWAWDPASFPTTINGNGAAPVSFAAASDSNTLSYLTLTGGGSNSAGILVSGDVRGLTVENCRIVSNKYGVSAVTVSLNATIRNTIVARNVLHGFYCPSATSKSGTCALYHCTVADNGDSGFYTKTDNWAWQSVTPVAKNSIFSGNGGFGIDDQNIASGSIQNCLFFGNARGPTATRWHGTPLIDAGGNKSGRDPKFIDPAALDYRVATDSPAAAAGIDLQAQGVTNDLAGAARPGPAGWDIGALQGSGSGEPLLPVQTYVRVGGDDVSGNGSQLSPWATLSHALGYTAASGTIYVAGGVYEDNLQFGPDKKAMTVRGGYNPNTWIWEPAKQSSVIRGGRDAAVLITAGAVSNTLAYLTLTGVTNGPGVKANGKAADLLIDACTIVSNQDVGISGGIFLQAPVVRNSIVADNGSHGIWFNTVVSGGNAGQCYLYNCTVAGNGGDGFMGNFTTNQNDVVPIAKNCLFTDNSGYGIRKGGDTTGGSIQNCLFYNNTSGTTFSVGTTLGDLGNNMTTNVRYLVASRGDYRLYPLSPAVDSGADLTSLGVTRDILGIPRPKGVAFDRGAYEVQAPPAGTMFSLR